MKPTGFTFSNGHLGEVRIWLDTDSDGPIEFGLDGPEFANYVYFTLEGLKSAVAAAEALMAAEKNV